MMGINNMEIVGIFFALCGVTYGEFFRQDYYFDHDVKGWLKYHPVPVNWENAVLKCHEEGGILASPLNEEFSKALSGFMVDLKVANVFTGISNIYTKSEFQSMEGVPISNICILWSVEPNAVTLASDTTCIAMNANGTVTGVSCSELHPFVCYRKAGIELNECGPVDAGFVFNNQTGSCYKGINKPALWSDSYKICARQGAHLVVINSQTEAEVIWGLAKKLISETPNLDTTYVNIGFHAWGEPNTWMTIHGQSLSDAGYVKWAPNQPSNPEERCGTIYTGGKFQDGILNDAKCIYKRTFICEIDPKVNLTCSV